MNKTFLTTFKVFYFAIVGVIGSVLLYTALLYNTLVNGFVFLKLFSWFIPERFIAYNMSYWEAVGIAFLINFATNKISSDPQPKVYFNKELLSTKKYDSYVFIITLLKGWAVLAIGFLIKNKFFIF
jgi:hypothetical protein